MSDARSSSGTGYVPADLAARIELYLDDMPSDGQHSDKAGANCWELLREAMEELRGVAQPSSGTEGRPIPLADHDDIGRKVVGQPWAIQAAIVTICAHCRVLVDNHPTGVVADLAGCISEQCLELANALSGGLAQGWRDISTAPRDGTELFFLRTPPYSATGNIIIGFWHDGQNVPGFQSNCGSVVDTRIWNRWMPVPDAIALSSTEGK